MTLMSRLEKLSMGYILVYLNKRLRLIHLIDAVESSFHNLISVPVLSLNVPSTLSDFFIFTKTCAFTHHSRAIFLSKIPFLTRPVCLLESFEKGLLPAPSPALT
jgi:hypothetical protein